MATDASTPKDIPHGNPGEAMTLFTGGLSCSEAIVTHYAPLYGQDPLPLRKAACALAGGLCGQGQTCGAVLGALMIIGVALAPEDPKDKDAKGPAIIAASQFMELFQATHGSCKCKDLLGRDISTPEGIKAVREDGTFARVCPPLVVTAAELLDDILNKDS